MKKLLTIIGTSAYLLIASTAFAQVPQKFNYQGIARDLKGNPMSKQQMALKLSVLPTADATVPEYEETQLVTTNEFGLYTLQIGNGTAITGDMKSVKWETGNKYIKVAIDAKGGSNYVDAGTSQLLSVPYALYADKAGTSIKSDKETRTGAVSSNAAHVAGDANYVTKFTAFNTIGRSLIFDNGSNIGIGTTTPLSSGRLHITSAAGTQPLILESPQGVHNLVRENGVNRGYFGSFIGSGAAQGYPTPAGTSNEDFDIGTSGASTGKLHFATNTTPRVTIMPTTGNVGIGTTSPTTKLDVVGQIKISGGAPGAGKVLTSDATGLATWQTPASGGGGAVASVNGATGAVVNSLTMGSAGTNTAVTGSGTNAVTINIPTASATNTGKLSSADWTTFNSKASTIGGTTNYIPKYTPNGTTLGNSKLIDNTTGLLYNTTSQDASFAGGGYTGLTIKNPAAAMTLKSSDLDWNYLNIVSPSLYKGFWLYDSINYPTNNYDSITFLHRNEDNNTFSIGSGFNENQFSVRMNDGKMGNTIGNAHFTINSNYDTAAHFTSSSSNSLEDGILRAEYTGSNVSDHVAIYGKSLPDQTDNYGIGVRAEGGYYGLQAVSNINSSLTNTGVQAYASSNGNSYGLNATADYYSIPNIGTKYGVRANANYGANNYGVYGTAASNQSGNGWGGYFAGKQTGVYGRADSASAYQTAYWGNLAAYKEAIGLLGVGNMSNGASGLHVNTGVAGTATTTGYFNIGVNGEASGATYNYGLFGYAPLNTFTSYAGFFSGDVYATNDLTAATASSGIKAFTIDHPLDPEHKLLRHSSVESPDMMNIYNGNVTTDANGDAHITLPDYFEALNKDFRYQLTVIGSFAQAMVSEKVANNSFAIKTNQPNTEVSWQITGIRHDAMAEKFRIVVDETKSPKMQGKYMWPQAYDKPASKGMNALPQADLRTERRTLPTIEEHNAEQAKEKADRELHEQKAKEAKQNWKPQAAPKATPSNATQKRN